MIVFASTLVATACLVGLVFFIFMTGVPGRAYDGPFGPLTPQEEEIAKGLEEHITQLATRIGPRNMGIQGSLKESVVYIDSTLKKYGYKTKIQEFLANGREMVNIEAELPGKFVPKEIIVLGSHYDSVSQCPGANDNGSGVAANLEIAKALAKDTPNRTIRFVFFPNEENPYFDTDAMGSKQYAELVSQANDNIIGMLSLETMGYFSNEAKSQHYPRPFSLFYPDRGNFIGFVGNLSSRPLLHKIMSSFRRNVAFPSQGIAAPEQIPGVSWSDQKCFWDKGYQALMVTDTAPFRYPDYHKPTDTADKINYPYLSRVVSGLTEAVRDLAKSGV